MKNLNTLIDQFIGEEKKRIKNFDTSYEVENANGYNQALQDLKSRKQELIEGIIEIIHKEKIISNNNTWQEGFDYCMDAVIKVLTGK